MNTIKQLKWMTGFLFSMYCSFGHTAFIDDLTQHYSDALIRFVSNVPSDLFTSLSDIELQCLKMNRFQIVTFSCLSEIAVIRHDISPHILNHIEEEDFPFIDKENFDKLKKSTEKQAVELLFFTNDNRFPESIAFAKLLFIRNNLYKPWVLGNMKSNDTSESPTDKNMTAFNFLLNKSGLIPWKVNPDLGEHSFLVTNFCGNSKVLLMAMDFLTMSDKGYLDTTLIDSIQ